MGNHPLHTRSGKTLEQRLFARRVPYQNTVALMLTFAPVQQNPPNRPTMQGPTPNFEHILNQLLTHNDADLADEFVRFTAQLTQLRTREQLSIADLGVSERELEVLRLICEGYTNAEIGEKLFISARTVDGHRNKLLLKTGAKNTATLVAFAITHKLVNL